MDWDSMLTGMIKYSRAIRLTYDEAIARAAVECELTRPEADVLLFLRNNPGLNTSSDVAYYRGLSKAYVSKAVEPLMRKGLISMRADENDRRRQLLTITGGAEIAERLRTAQLDFWHRLTQDIPQSNLDTFMDVNRAMCENAMRK